MLQTYFCKGLTSIEIPDSVTSIGEGAFSGCSSLASISVSSGNMNYRSENGVLFSKDFKEFLCFPAGCSKKVFVIPNSVTSIGEGAFCCCDGLTSIEIPSSVTSIGKQVFCCCDGLTSIEIPSSVTSIGEWAFSRCI